MKRLLFFILTISILITSTPQQIQAAELDLECAVNDFGYSFDYAEILKNTDYDRICKNAAGQWLGVIEVTDVQLMQKGTSSFGTQNFVLINFSRDLSSLEEVKIHYTTKSVCDGFNLFGLCLGGWSDAEEKEHIIVKDSTSTVDAFFGYSDIDADVFGYDYAVALPDDNVDHATVISFKYILTNFEIDSLKINIQAQFEEELELILTNESISEEQKNIDVQALLLEYAGLEIDYGEVMESPCIPTVENNHCSVDIPDANPILQQIKDFFTTILLYVASGITLALVSYIIASYIIKQTFKTSGDIAKGTVKLISKSGNYWANVLLTAVQEFFKNIHNAITVTFKSYTPVFYFILLALLGMIIFL